MYMYHTICCILFELRFSSSNKEKHDIHYIYINIQCIYRFNFFFFCRHCWGFSTKFTVWLFLKTFPLKQKTGLKVITPCQKSTKNLTKQPTTVLLRQGFMSSCSFFPAVNKDWTLKPVTKCLKRTTAKCDKNN